MDPIVFTSLTDAVDFSNVTTGMLAVAAVTAVMYVAWKGIGMILSAIKR